MFKGFKKLVNKIGLKKALVYSARALLFRTANRLKGSFSQKGEDLVIDKILQHKSRGFYVDIGAHHPTRLSNTYRFYKKGWAGINIEPNPTMHNLLLRKRPRDINLNVGVSNKTGYMQFYEFRESAMSTFSKRSLKRYRSLGYILKKTHKIEVDTLSNTFTKHNIKNVDFMSIDTEGGEMKILKSNDWKRFRPTILCIETAEHNIVLNQDDNLKQKISKFLIKQGYKEYFSNGLNTIYIDKRWYLSRQNETKKKTK